MVNGMESKVSSAIAVLFRLYIGYTFLMAGWHKITVDLTHPYLKAPLLWQRETPLSSMGNIFRICPSNVEIFNFLVAWGEFLVGLALILGIFTTFAALMGITMNFAFLFSGTISSNPQMVLITIFILVAGANAGRYGLDRWVLPYVRKVFNKEAQKPVVN